MWAGVQQASRALVDSSQAQHVSTVVDQVTAAAPSVQYPPVPESLDQLRVAVGANSLVRDDAAESGEGLLAAGADAVPPELRDAVHGSDGARGVVATQRVVIDDRPWLMIGTGVMLTGPDGARVPSGVEVYTARDLSDIDAEVAGLVRHAAGTSLLALPVAALIALAASRSVLRPVDRLRVAARRLADGDLAARTEPAGVDELAQLTRTVNEMAASLQEHVAATARLEEDARRFAADVSHELRTPLTTLTAAVEVLHDALARPGTPDDDEDVRESARLALVETRRLVRLVEEIMEIARLDAGTADLRREDADLLEIARHAVRARGWEDAVAVELLDAPSGGEATGRPVIPGDRRRLDVVVANLVGNALEHARPPVRVTIATAAEEVVVTVTDHGDGIPDDALPRVFRRFYKADPARSRAPGSGLGLAIARENVRLHGGTITAANAPGAGAVLTVRLPRDPAADAEEEKP